MYATLKEWREVEAANLNLAENEEGEVVETKITTAIKQASRIADSYLGSRYSLPIRESLALDVIRSHIIPLATYELARTNNSVTEDIKERADRSVDWLMSVGQGRVKLPTTGGAGGGDSGAGAPAGSSGVEVRHSAKPRRRRN